LTIDREAATSRSPFYPDTSEKTRVARVTPMAAMTMSASTAAFRANVARRAPRGRAINTSTRAFFGGAKPTVAAGTIHDFTVNDIDQKPVALSKYAGKAVLIVNVASA
jgi:glutathione peroxidase